MDLTHMRGKAQRSILGVTQPRFCGTNFRIVLSREQVLIAILTQTLQFPCCALLVALPLLILFLCVGLKCASTPLLTAPIVLDRVEFGSTIPSAFSLDRRPAAVATPS
jgi:hypothetical protein